MAIKINKTKRPIITNGDIAYVPLSNTELVAIIDIEDVELVSRYNWHPCRYRDTTYVTTGRPSVRLHRLIMRVTNPKLDVDHTNHNGLDCRKSNLKICTRSQNLLNRLSANKTSQSGIRGLHARVRERNGHVYTYWVAKIYVNKRVHEKYYPYTNDGLHNATEWLNIQHSIA